MTKSEPDALYVDLDGTLIRSDLLLESVFRLLGRNLLMLFKLPFWLLQGKARLKQQIAERVDLNISLLPFNEQVVEYLKKEKGRGRRLYLISASNQKYVTQVARHIGLFDDAFGSSIDENLKGKRKLDRIRSVTGDQPFAYAGNERADLAIWAQASEAVVVEASTRVRLEASRLSNVVASFERGTSRLRAFVRASRVHQWAKNLLLFVPLVLSHGVTDAGLLMQSLVAFVSFSFCASSVYLLNDLVDLQHDRRHTTKRNRPLAAGDLPLTAGIAGSGLLLMLAFALAATLNWQYLIVLLGYYLLTLCYSFSLKAIVIVDVLILACLYTTRLIAGAAAISIIPTFWLLAFSMFLFMSLAIVKRVAELDNLRLQDKRKARGRGYRAEDIEQMSMLGSASGLMAVLVFALYINDEATRVLYATPQVLWFICPLLLYLIGRIWLLTRRGQLSEDPVVFFITDHGSQVVVLLGALLMWAATIDWF